MGRAGVVDEDVEPAKGRDNLARDPGNLLTIRDIAAERLCPPPSACAAFSAASPFMSRSATLAPSRRNVSAMP
jgi:hypothetical protein